jgi:hypothetical protein
MFHAPPSTTVRGPPPKARAAAGTVIVKVAVLAAVGVPPKLMVIEVAPTPAPVVVISVAAIPVGRVPPIHDDKLAPGEIALNAASLRLIVKDWPLSAVLTAPVIMFAPPEIYAKGVPAGKMFHGKAPVTVRAAPVELTLAGIVIVKVAVLAAVAIPVTVMVSDVAPAVTAESTVKLVALIPTGREPPIQDDKSSPAENALNVAFKRLIVMV